MIPPSRSSRRACHLHQEPDEHAVRRVQPPSQHRYGGYLVHVDRHHVHRLHRRRLQQDTTKYHRNRFQIGRYDLHVSGSPAAATPTTPGRRPRSASTLAANTSATSTPNATSTPPASSQRRRSPSAAASARISIQLRQHEPDRRQQAIIQAYVSRSSVGSGSASYSCRHARLLIPSKSNTLAPKLPLWGSMPQTETAK